MSTFAFASAVWAPADETPTNNNATHTEALMSPPALTNAVMRKTPRFTLRLRRCAHYADSAPRSEAPAKSERDTGVVRLLCGRRGAVVGFEAVEAPMQVFDDFLFIGCGEVDTH